MPTLGPYLQNNTGNVNFKDFKHASRLYLDGAFKLMPKASWLYYVTFEVQSNVIKDIIFSGRQKQAEIGALVKAVDLPKFQINTETLNQYNRKTIIQKNITYQPVSFTFHDDISNYTSDMWVNYYHYYYNDDPQSNPTLKSTLEGLAKNALNSFLGSSIGGFVFQKLQGKKNDANVGPYANTKYMKASDKFNPTTYGLNVPSTQSIKAPFFRSITIYQLNQHKFTSYQLINPMIKNWEHDRLDQTSGNKLAESKMTVEYESVVYGKGSVSRDNPAGFAVFDYDNEPSPLGVGAPGATSLLNGILTGAEQVFGSILSSVAPQNSVILDAISAVSAVGVGNFAGIVAGNFSSQGRQNTGYSTLNSVGYTPSSSLNGLGVNLNLNLGNNPATSGQVQAQQVAVAPNVPAVQTVQSFGVNLGDGKFTQASAPNGVPPTSSTPISASTSFSASIANLNTIILQAQISQPSENTTPAGTTPAPGKYFPTPVPLVDASPYTATNITSNSTIPDIQTAITFLNKSWANDNDFVAKQVLNPSDVNAKLAQASSPEEFNAIKSSASSTLLALESLQTVVDGKYKNEYSRLTGLLAAKQTNLQGSINLT